MAHELPNRPIFFLHVPKTAGTSVRHLLEAPFRKEEIVRIHSSEEEIVRRRKERFGPGIKFVSGHVPHWFGEALGESRQTLLFLRDPVERVLSTYYFWKNLPKPAPEDTSHEAERVRQMEGVSLEEFVSDPQAPWVNSISNFACRLLGHAQPWALSSPFNERVQNLACERLEIIEMLGIVERLGQSLQQIARCLQIPFSGELSRVNATPRPLTTSETPRSILNAIRDANAGDMLLLERANAELSRRLRVAPQFPQVFRRDADSEGRFRPNDEDGGMTLRPGMDPILGTGWLAPERAEDSSWRFASSPGPASLYVDLSGDAPLSMIVECPFAAPGFDFSSLAVAADGEPLYCHTVQAPGRIMVFTSPIAKRAGTRLREITFSYAPPPLDAKHNDTRPIAFAVGSLTWVPISPGDVLTSWSNFQLLSKVMEDGVTRAERQATEAARYAASLAIAIKERHLAALESAAQAKDEYISTLEATLEQKDQYIVSLLRTLEERTPFSR